MPVTNSDGGYTQGEEQEELTTTRASRFCGNAVYTEADLRSAPFNLVFPCLVLLVASLTLKDKLTKSGICWLVRHGFSHMQISAALVTTRGRVLFPLQENELTMCCPLWNPTRP
jgi:hypothetical protein